MTAAAEKQFNKAMLDCIKYGEGVIKQGIRKWYNPMRWIRGLHYVKRIKPKDFYK